MRTKDVMPLLVMPMIANILWLFVDGSWLFGSAGVSSPGCWLGS